MSDSEFPPGYVQPEWEKNEPARNWSKQGQKWKPKSKAEKTAGALGDVTTFKQALAEVEGAPKCHRCKGLEKNPFSLPF